MQSRSKLVLRAICRRVQQEAKLRLEGETQYLGGIVRGDGSLVRFGGRPEADAFLACEIAGHDQDPLAAEAPLDLTHVAWLMTIVLRNSTNSAQVGTSTNLRFTRLSSRCWWKAAGWRNTPKAAGSLANSSLMSGRLPCCIVNLQLGGLDIREVSDVRLNLDGSDLLLWW